MSEKRSSFTGKIGFVLAAAGSAVGLGNIWRFPYLAAKYGGGIFLLVYIALAVTFGFALMCAEIAIGRKTGFSAVKAFGALNKKYRFKPSYLLFTLSTFLLGIFSVVLEQYLTINNSSDFSFLYLILSSSPKISSITGLTEIFPPSEIHNSHFEYDCFFTDSKVCRKGSYRLLRLHGQAVLRFQ